MEKVKKRYTDEEKRIWESLYFQGYSVLQISKKQHVSRKAIYTHFYNNNIILTETDPERMNPPQDAILIDGYILRPDEAQRLREIQQWHIKNGNKRTKGVKSWEEE